VPKNEIIVTTKSKTKHTINITAKNGSTEIPLLVIINESASASEIVAGRKI
jgi:C-terminal processing protease CtpA/Prc